MRYQLRKVGPTKAIKNKSGEQIAMVAEVHLHAPTKKGDDWTYYIAELRLNSDNRIFFDITHISSSAWGNSAMRTAPFGYERKDIKDYVLKECYTLLNTWRQEMGTQ